MAIIWNEAFKQIKVLTPPDNPAIFGFFIEGTKIPETTIIYNDSLVASFDVGTATLPVKDLKMKTDIVITVPEAEGGGTDSAIPIEVATEAEMTALLESGEVGGVYKYTGTTGTYENEALYVLENALITFTIDGTSYQAEEGMIWNEWTLSDYNTDGVYCSANMVVYNSNYVSLDGVSGVDANDVITATDYTLWGGTSSGGMN